MQTLEVIIPNLLQPSQLTENNTKVKNFNPIKIGGIKS